MTSNHRVQALLREIDSREVACDTVEIDQALSESMMVLASLLPMPERRIENAFTIAAGANTFSLPAEEIELTSDLGDLMFGGPVLPVGSEVSTSIPFEYGGAISLQRASDGMFLEHVTLEKMDGLRDGLADGRTGPPRYFMLWEEAGQVVSGFCYPRAERAEPCHLHFAHVPDAFDLDTGTDSFSRYARHALVHHAAAMLLARMPETDRSRRRIRRDVITRWRADGFRAAHAAESHLFDVASGVGMAGASDTAPLGGPFGWGYDWGFNWGGV